jgi:peptidyl-prolyl cis-trans isomerase B (cyclophilin B)
MSDQTPPPGAPQEPSYAAQPAPNPYAPAPQYAGGQYGAPAAPGSRYNVLAIVSLVTAFFISLVAIVTGHIALSQIKRTGENGRGLAIAGLVIGYCGLVAGIIAAIVWIIVAVNFASSGYSTSP